MYASNTMECATEAWINVRDDTYVKIRAQQYIYDFYTSDINSTLMDFEKKSSTVSFDSTGLKNFINSAILDIRNFNDSLLPFNHTIELIDDRAKDTIDNLTRTAYQTSIKSIENSVIKKKNCTTDITIAMNNIFEGLRSALSTCTQQLLNINPIDRKLSLAHRFAIGVIKRHYNCFANKNTTGECLRNVSFMLSDIQNLYYRPPLTPPNIYMVLTF